MVYIGVDLHRKRSQLAALDADGAQLFNRSIPSRPAEFLRVFGELAPEPIEVAAFEATVGWGWFADLLADAGVAAHMARWCPACPAPKEIRMDPPAALTAARSFIDVVTKMCYHLAAVIHCRYPRRVFIR